jgi:NitT/TauT family transport system substrate-binding protein
MRKSLFVAMLFALSAPAMAQVETPDVKIALDWAFQGPQSVFLYGVENGAFSKEGLNVQVDRGNGSSETIVRVASGAYQFGWADIATMVKFNAEHPGNELVAVYVTGGASPLAVITEEGRGIKTPKDLEGRTLGATAGSAALAMFDVFAKKAGFDPSKVTWQNVSGALREPMMVRGDLVAVAGFTTSSIMSVVQLGVPLEKIVVMRYNDYGLKQYGTAIIMRPDFAAKNPKTTAAVVRAINAAFIGAIANPVASTNAIKSKDPLVNIASECARLVDGLETLTLTKEFRANGIGTVDKARMQEAVLEIQQAYNIKADMPLDKVYSDTYLPEKSARIPPSLGSCKVSS